MVFTLRSVRKLLRSWFSTRQQPPLRKKRMPLKMRLEFLEDRLTPAAFVAASSGDWETPATWGLASGFPGAGDTVTINNSKVVTISSGENEFASSVTLGGASAGALVMSVNDSLTLTGSGASVFNINTGGVFQSGVGTVNYVGTAATTIASTTYNNLGVGTTSDNNGVTYTLGGDTTVANILTVGNAASTAVDTLDASTHTLTLSGSSTPFVITSKGAFSASTSTVDYTNTVEVGVTGATYYNLGLGTTADSSAANFDVAGNLTVNNVLTVGNSSSSAVDTLNASTFTITLAGSGVPFNITSNGAFNSSASTVKYTSGSGATVTGGITYNDLTVNGTGTFSLAGTTNISDKLRVTTGTLQADGTVNVTNGVTVDGTLAGVGTIHGAVTVDSTGVVSPGDNLGILTVDSADFSGGGTLLAQINGYTTAGTDYDRLAVTGTLVVGGTSHLSLVVGGVSADGTATGVATYGTLAGGTFSSVSIINVYQQTPTYNAHSLDISLHGPLIVWVNDNWVDAAHPSNPQNGDIVTVPAGETAPNSAGATFIIGVDAFTTIQGGINAVVANGTVYVLAGTYTESVVINKAISLLGANNAADPTNGGTRGTESIIQPGVSGASPYSGTHTFLITLLSSNVTVEGFTLTGQNTNLPNASGVQLTETGSPIFAQAVEGIASFNPTGIGDISVTGNIPSYAPPANINIQNNIIENLSYQGVDIGWGSNSTPTAGNTIGHNLIQNIGAYNDEGAGVRLYNNFYADVVHNQMLNVRMGVENGNYSQANPGTTGSIANNEIQARRRGIFYNLFYGTSTAIPVQSNMITATADDPAIVAGASLWTGMYILTQQNTVTGTFTNNTINGSGNSYAISAGYTVLDTWSTTAVTISGGTVSNVSYGVWEDSGDPNGLGASAETNMALTVSGVAISAATYGVYVDADPSSTFSVAATIKNNTSISTGGAGTAVFISGALASANITGNLGSINGNLIGIDVNAGSATVSGNHIYNDGTGIRLTNGGTASVDNNDFTSSPSTPNGSDLRLDSSAGTLSSLTGNKFAGSTDFIDNRSAQSVNATTDTFNVGTAGAQVGGNSLTLAQAYAIEDKILDAIDFGSWGLVRIKTANVYVTPNSFFNPSTSAADIQRGINAASNSDTVNVEAGTYNESGLTVNKPLTLLGANAGVAGAGTRGLESVILDQGNQTSVIALTSGSVTIDGFTINGDDPLTTGATLASGDDANASYGIGGTSNNFSNVVVQNNIIEKVSIGFRGIGAATGSLITNNWFDSIGNFDFGYAVSIQQDYYADVTNNKMTRVWSGVHMNNFHNAGGPATWNISGNNIQSYAGGILYWLEYGSATSATINNNQITEVVPPGGPVANNFGILFVTVQNTVSPTVTNNTITGTDYGIGLTDTSTSNVITLGATNSIVNTKLAGVYLTDNLTFNPIGLTNLAIASSDPIAVNVNGMSITTTQGVGVKVETSRAPANPDVNTTATINNNTTITTGGPTGTGTGILVTGAQATAIVSGNFSSIHDNLIGIDVNGGSATVTANHIFNNGTGIKVENGGTLSATNNFITANTGPAVLVASTGTPTVTLHDNGLAGNGTPVINNTNSGMAVDAAENYWGSTNTTLAAVATLVSGNVNFEPILTTGDADLVTGGFQPNLSNLLVDINSPAVNPSVGTPVTLNLAPANPTSNNTTLTKWVIHWGDTSPDTTVNAPSIPNSVMHTFTNGGNITITATATDELGNTAVTTLNMTVTITTSTTVTSSTPTTVYGAPVTFTASVSPGSGVIPPTAGSVSFFDNGNLLGTSSTETPSGNVAVFTLTTTARQLQVTGATHTITAHYNHASFFSDSAGTLSGGITVSPAPLTISAVTNTKTYDSTTSAAATPASLGLVTGDTITGATEVYTDINFGSSKTLSVSAYTVNDSNGGNNYAVSTAVNTTGSITTANVTITPTTQTKTYDSTVSATAIPTVSGLKGADVATGLGEAYNNANAGSGTGKPLSVTTFTISNPNNYTVVLKTTPGAILPAPLTVTAITNSKGYDSLTTATALPSHSPLIGGDTISGLTEVYADKNAGTGKTLSVSAYTIADGNGGNNYAVTPVNNTTGIITKATLTITATTNTKTYDSLTSAAALPTVTALVGGDSVTGLADVYSDVNVGTGKTLSVGAYTINDGVGGNNYTVTTVVNTTGAITQATLTITATTNTKTYDSTTAAAALPTVTGLKGNDSISGQAETYNNANAGLLKILSVSTYTLNTNGNNYSVVLNATTGVITAAPLTITATTYTKTYDSTTSAAALPTVSGLVGSDSISGLVEVFNNANAGATKAISVSAYTINDGNSGGNYAVMTVANTTGTITKAPLTITATTNTKTYDATASAAALGTVTGLVGLDSVSTLTESYASANAGSSLTLTVNPYTVNDGNSGNNYSIATAANTTGVISKALLTITALTNTKMYDATVTAAALPTVSGLRGADSVTGRAEVYSDKNAGSTKTLSVSAYTINDGNGGNNYAIGTVSNTTGLITKAPLTITASPNTKVFDGNTSSIATPTFSGLQGLDSATASELYTDANVGTGKTLSVSAYSIGDGNGGNNYTVLPTVANFAGVINPSSGKSLVSLDVGAGITTITTSPTGTVQVFIDFDNHTASGTSTGSNGSVAGGSFYVLYDPAVLAISPEVGGSVGSDIKLGSLVSTVPGNAYTLSPAAGFGTGVVAVNLNHNSSGAFASTSLTGHLIEIDFHVLQTTPLGLSSLLDLQSNFTDAGNGGHTTNIHDKGGLLYTLTPTPTQYAGLSSTSSLTQSGALTPTQFTPPDLDTTDVSVQIVAGTPSRTPTTLPDSYSMAPNTADFTTTMTASGLANGVLGNDTATTNGPMNAVLTGGVLGSTAITPQSLSVSTATETGNVVTITTTSTGTFVPGAEVTVAGVGSGYDGTYAIATVLSTTQFTYTAQATNMADGNAGTVSLAATTVLTGNTANGTVWLNELDGSFAYTPAPGFVGIDTFTYQAVDAVSHTASVNTTVTINVGGYLSIPQNLKLTSVGDTVVVPVNLASGNPANSGGLTNATIGINYDASKLSLPDGDLDVSEGTLNSAAGWTNFTVNTNTPGQIVIATSNTGGALPLSSTAGGSLAFITFTLVGQPTGTSVVNLSGLVPAVTQLDVAGAGTGGNSIPLPFAVSPVDNTNFNGSPGTVDGLVTFPIGTTTTVSAQVGGTSVTTVTYGTQVTLKATVTAASGSTAPTAGSVDFQDNGNDLGLVTTEAISGTKAIFTLVTTSTQLQVLQLGGGIHSITTIYTPGTSDFYSDETGNLTSGLNVTPAALTITATTNTKMYDGSTSAAAAPTVSGLIGSDSVTGLAEIYANRNAGSSKILSVSAYTVNDGNGGNNYSVTKIVNATGLINRATLTITALTDTKMYDSTVTAAALPTVTGLQGADSVTGQVEVYSDKNAGSSKTLSVSVYTVNDGAGGNNYMVSTASNATGLITKAPLTITARPNTKSFDGTTSAVSIPTATALVGADSVSGLVEVYTDANVGTGKTLSVSAYSISDGNGGNNYSVTTTPNFAGVINPSSGKSLVSLDVGAGITTITTSPTGTVQVFIDFDNHTASGTTTGSNGSVAGGSFYVLYDPAVLAISPEVGGSVGSDIKLGSLVSTVPGNAYTLSPAAGFGTGVVAVNLNHNSSGAFASTSLTGHLIEIDFHVLQTTPLGLSSLLDLQSNFTDAGNGGHTTNIHDKGGLLYTLTPTPTQYAGLSSTSSLTQSGALTPTQFTPPDLRIPPTFRCRLWRGLQAGRRRRCRTVTAWRPTRRTSRRR